MRIGIITIHNSPNYGASLQSYALWRYLVDCGHDCELIDLHRPFQSDYVPSKRFCPCRTPRKGIKDRLKSLVKRTLFGKRKEDKFLEEEAKRKFEAFNATIKQSHPYLGVDELYDNPPLYDLYVSGSDQLWNPSQPYCLEPYLLTFVPQGRPCISYASSIGITELNDKEKQLFKEALSKYRAISVRESQAKHLLESFIGREVYQVADPTFLLTKEQWESITVFPRNSDKYILLFTLSFNDSLLQYVLELGKQCGLRVVYLTAMQPEQAKGYDTVNTAGPQEWLGYIARAEMVVTDSFHGTVFSILMGANNFFTYISPTNKRGSRITDLLGTFQLKKHLLDPSLSQSYEQLNELRINHADVNEIINRESNRSKLFLKKYTNRI